MRGPNVCGCVARSRSLSRSPPLQDSSGFERHGSSLREQLRVSLYSPSVSKIGRLKAIVRALECLLRARVHVPVVSGVAVGSQLQGVREHGL